MAAIAPRSSRKLNQGEGAPSWLITFADLMSLLVCFFVLIISFSIQDTEKLQIVAGSMRDAFGVRADSSRAGMIEQHGTPLREYVADTSPIEQTTDTDFADMMNDEHQIQGPEANTHDIERAEDEFPQMFLSAAASLRQAWQNMPEIAELSRQILLEETEEGLHIILMDQDGRSMFPDGSAYPYNTTVLLLQAIAPVLDQMPQRIQITGHTTAGQPTGDPTFGPMELSVDRANAARQILEAAGVRADQFYSVVGKGAGEPMIPNDVFSAANRRVEILLMAEAPPLPPSFRP